MTDERLCWEIGLVKRFLNTAIANCGFAEQQVASWGDVEIADSIILHTRDAVRSLSNLLPMVIRVQSDLEEKQEGDQSA